MLGGLRLADLVLSSKKAKEAAPLAVAAATISFASVFALALLSPAEHAKSLRPSTVLTLCLLVSCVFDAVRARSFWFANSMALSGVTLAAVAIQFVLFLTEAWEKRAFALEQGKGDS